MSGINSGVVGVGEYVTLAEVKAGSTNGTIWDFTLDDGGIVDINTYIGDKPWCSLAANLITLNAGEYVIDLENAIASANRTIRCSTSLVDTLGNVICSTSPTQMYLDTRAGYSETNIKGRFFIKLSSDTSFYVKNITQSDNYNAYTSWAAKNLENWYCQLRIKKVA
jgi:hypothetical protein